MSPKFSKFVVVPCLFIFQTATLADLNHAQCQELINTENAKSKDKENKERQCLAFSQQEKQQTALINGIRAEINKNTLALNRLTEIYDPSNTDSTYQNNYRNQHTHYSYIIDNLTYRLAEHEGLKQQAIKSRNTCKSEKILIGKNIEELLIALNNGNCRTN